MKLYAPWTAKAGAVIDYASKVNSIKRVRCKHLFIVPQIRSTHYTFLLSGAMPYLRDSQPGDLRDPNLPDLRNLVVVNNEATNRQEWINSLHGLKSAIDWREIFCWQPDRSVEARHRDLTQSLLHNEVINLQFTRWVSKLDFYAKRRWQSQWYNRFDLSPTVLDWSWWFCAGEVILRRAPHFLFTFCE